jgi:hypothetical protein
VNKKSKAVMKVLRDATRQGKGGKTDLQFNFWAIPFNKRYMIIEPFLMA